MLASYRVHLIARNLTTIIMLVSQRVQIMMHEISESVKILILDAYSVEPSSLYIYIYIYIYTRAWIQNSVVGIATRYRLDCPGIESQ